MPESKTSSARAAESKKRQPEREPEAKRPEPEREPEAKRPEPERGPAPKRPGRPRKTPLETRLADFLSVISAGFVAAGDWHCGTLLADRAEDVAGAWARLAKRNKRIERALETLLTGGEWGEVVVVTATTVLPMAAHHGLVPERFSLLSAFVGPEEPAPAAGDGAPRPFPAGGPAGPAAPPANGAGE